MVVLLCTFIGDMLDVRVDISTVQQLGAGHDHRSMRPSGRTRPPSRSRDAPGNRHVEVMLMARRRRDRRRREAQRAREHEHVHAPEPEPFDREKAILHWQQKPATITVRGFAAAGARAA